MCRSLLPCQKVCSTSAGVYTSAGVLVRTLWSNVAYPNAGTYTACWDGADDNGIIQPNGTYQVRVLSNNVNYVWEGVVGNTSQIGRAVPCITRCPPFKGLAVTGTTAYFAAGYNEANTTNYRFDTGNPQAKTNYPGERRGGFLCRH